MHDVLGSYQRLERLYRLYIKSAFPLRSSILADERDALLGRAGILSQPPLVETVPVYPSADLTLADAVRQLPAEYAGLAALGQQLLPPPLMLYRHQWQSLHEALVRHNDIVVTTGTGSGKTECFLLPLLGQLARESATWPAAGNSPTQRFWWNDSSARVSQWGHVERPTALRAVILYPLNALVEDQLRRLRMTLDDDRTHHWLDQERGCNRITFGRYTGLTPVPGRENDSRRERLRQDLAEMDQQRRQVMEELRKDPKRDRDIQYYFPRMDGGEMWSRWDMQETPPDILITNYSMLNIMLMRSIEDDIFSKTRDWLAEDNHPEREFFLIIDELHAYRGTPGTEVSYILRLLLTRLGLEPNSPKLRILTTTASLDSDDRGRKFLREFFGRDRFAFIAGEQTLPKPGRRTVLMPFQVAFEQFARSVQPDWTDGAPDPATGAVKTQIAELAARLGQPSAIGESEEERLAEALVRVEASDALRDACRAVAPDSTVRPAQAPKLDAQLYPAAAKAKAANALTSDAFRGLLLALGMSRRKSTGGRSPQPVRGHLFYHNLQNLWACCDPACRSATVNLTQRDAAEITERPVIGALHAVHRLACECGARVLDLIVCEVCGDLFLGGYRAARRIGTQDIVFLTPDQPDLEAMPDRVSLSQRHEDYAVFWPLPHGAPWQDRPLDAEWIIDGVRRRWVEAKLNRITGRLQVTTAVMRSQPLAQDEIPGWLYQIPGDQGTLQAAMPEKCPRCDADYRKRKTHRSPLRNHRTGFQKATQVLADALFREMGGETMESRKLVVFSDSRQDAAKLAGGIERDHFRDMVRLALIQSFRSYWPGLVAFLRQMLANSPANLPVVEALNPGLFAMVTEPLEAEDVVRARAFQAAASAELRTEALMWLMNLPPANASARDAWLAILQAYPGRIVLSDLLGTVRDSLLRLGMCPGGSSKSAIRYHGGGGEGQTWLPWFTCYDWRPVQQQRQELPAQIVNPSPQQRNHLARMEDLLIGELMYALFPHMARTLEGLGQGWVSFRPQDNPLPQLVATTDAVIRQLGVRRLHQYAEHFWAGSEDRLRPFSARYINNCGITTAEVHQQLLRSGAALSSANGIALAPNGLTLVPPPPADSRLGYRCRRCNAFYLHNVGICPECPDPPEALVQSSLPRDFDYYTDLTERADAVYFRMNCEELSGQTDKEERPRRQRWFQEIFIGNELQKLRGIDLLSVTTTMEAGVDIGALNAVVMANMPPRRFNYQQRVGRAGRRAGGVSLAVTFCRGRSHDDFYFQRPESMTGDPPPPPYVDMRSVPIFRRVLIKEALRRAFVSVLGSIGVEGGDNVHGEFGQAADWPQYRDAIGQWLANPANVQAMTSVMEALAVETPWQGDQGTSTRAALLQYLQQQLVPEINAIADPTSPYAQEALSERLANAGQLPMFGFPTRVRLLFTFWPRQARNWPPETGTIDRNLDIAISQFAPGSQTVKDKAVHSAAGVVAFRPRGRIVTTEDGFFPPLSQPYSRRIGLCANCQAVLPFDEIPPAGQACLVCGATAVRVVDAREPRGFFTDLEPEDFEGQFEWSPRATRPSMSIGEPSNPGATSTTGNALVASVTDSILSLNDKGGEGGFDFRAAKVRDQIMPGAYAEDSGITGGNAGSQASGPISTFGQPRRIALLARRLTDILLVGIERWPAGVFADPTTVEGRAAWYSFAFWLRLAAGAHLDVDALELQAGFRSISRGGRAIGQAFLCDQLENGAGYCRELAQPQQFEQLLVQGNPMVPRSIAAVWTDLAAVAGAAEPHALECDTSCNRCLRDFHNLPYHGLLDWRLALDMAGIALSADFVPDLDEARDGRINPWANLVNGADKPIPATLARLNYGRSVGLGTLRGYVHQASPILVIERHPLWQDDHPKWLAATAEAQARYPRYQIKAINPFRALRRPADCL